MTNAQKNKILRKFNEREIIRIKIFFTNGKLFHGKSSGLDPLNSYLVFHFNKFKRYIEATGILIKVLMAKALSFTRFRNCGRNCSNGKHFYGEPKDKGFQRC
jgi:hypothetical protein